MTNGFRRYFLVFFLAFFLPSYSFAHPVSFKDGIGVMPGYSPERTELELNYSYSVNSAAALNFIDIDYKGDDIRFLLPQFNHKFYRKNELGSQTNLYGSFGVGGANYKGDTNPAVLAAFQADYETRRVYTLLYAEHLQTEGVGLNRVRYRAGIAPYLANYEDLNTWVILQTEYTPELDDEFTVTPLIRLFYNNFLIEGGVSFKGDPFFAGIFHF